MPTSNRKKYKKGFYKRAKIYGRAANQLYKDVKYLKSIVNVEKKFIDSTVSAQNITNTGALSLLNGVTTGDSMSTRDGQSIKCISILFSGKMRLTSVANVMQVRLIIFRDMQANGAAPAATDLLVSASVTSALNLSNGKRFSVLYDRRFTLEPNGDQGAFAHFFRKLNFHTRFNTGTAGTIADIQTNSLYLLYLSDEATNYPLLTSDCRVRFIDN